MAHRFSTLDDAVSALLEIHGQNQWFTGVYWPENATRVRRMVTDARSLSGPDGRLRLLDIGCAGGYVSLLLAGLGVTVTATDGNFPGDQQALLEGWGIRCLTANLNNPSPLAGVAPGDYDVVLLGEVLEHVLNHPLGLMREIGRVLRPGGRLILTTPNPANVMNAWRLLRGQPLAWGAAEFANLPKLVGETLAPYEHIHYHEYTVRELHQLLQAAGFTVEQHAFMSVGSSPGQHPLKRLLKRTPVVSRLFGLRAFGCTHYVISRNGN